MENDKTFELLTKMYAEMNKRFDDVNEKFGVVDKRFDDVDKKFDNVDRRFDDVNKKLDAKADKSDIVRIENKLDKDSKALFDGYKQNSEQLNRIEQEVSRNEEVVLKRVK